MPFSSPPVTGAALLASSNVFTASGTASTSAVALTGTPFAGTGTTAFPLFYLNQAGATAATALSTAGTFIGVNAVSGFAGNLLDVMTNGVRMFNVTGAGVVNIGPANSAGINFSGTTISGTSSGVATSRPSIQFNVGLGSSIVVTTAGISAADGFIVGAQGQAANTNFFGGFASNTAYTFNIRPTAKDFFGSYTGAGNILALAGGTASSVTTGGAGGNLTITGGAAAGSGNNNGGDVVITGGAKTGSGTVGLVRISSLPTTNPGPGILWNNAGTPAIGT